MVAQVTAGRNGVQRLSQFTFLGRDSRGAVVTTNNNTRARGAFL